MSALGEPIGCLSLTHYMDKRALEGNTDLAVAPKGGTRLAALPNPWVLRARRGPGRLRLFCLPYAGGAASAYHACDEGLPADVEVCPVQLLGRGWRFR